MIGTEGRWLNTKATNLDLESLVTISISPQKIFLSFIISADRMGWDGLGGRNGSGMTRLQTNTSDILRIILLGTYRTSHG